MSYETFTVEHQRRLILEVLAQQPQYTQNQLLIKQALYMQGQGVSIDKVMTHLAWLAEQGAVTLDSFGGFSVAKLTARGLDIAQGLADVPGIAKLGLV
ncbi:MAG: hypothetical protein AB7D03_03765 [Thiomicrospira sp.]